MKDVTKSDLRRRNPLDRRALTEDEIDSIHLANIAREFSMLHRHSLCSLVVCCGLRVGCLVYHIVLEEIGQRLHVRQIIIYTAVIFYRRFYQTYATGWTVYKDWFSLTHDLTLQPELL
jgi:hypothetical protein